MIKKAKVGDVVYAYKFNCENYTCKIKKIKIKRDFNADTGSDIWYGYVGFISPNDAFWEYDEAKARYLVDLEKSLKQAQKKLKQSQKKIDRINKILLENQPPYLEEPVWKSKNEMSIGLLNIVDSLPE